MTLPPRIFRKSRRDLRLRSPENRLWVRTHACCVSHCSSESKIIAAHVRMGAQAGMGMKPGDDVTVSMCDDHHREQHQIGEPEFMRKYGIDLVALAKEFADTSPALRRLRKAAS